MFKQYRKTGPDYRAQSMSVWLSLIGVVSVSTTVGQSVVIVSCRLSSSQSEACTLAVRAHQKDGRDSVQTQTYFI